MYLLVADLLWLARRFGPAGDLRQVVSKALPLTPRTLYIVLTADRNHLAGLRAAATLPHFEVV